MFFSEKMQKYLKLIPFIPIVNWIMIISLGIHQMRLSYIFTGLISIAISIFNIYLLLIFWIIGIFYSRFLVKVSLYDKLVHENLLEAENASFQSGEEEYENFQDYDVFEIGQGHNFAESDFEVMANRRQSKPVENFANIAILERYFQALSERERFLLDMRKYADVTKDRVESVDFFQYWPSYKGLSHAQKYWYFYWRTEIRNGNYLNTSLSYIYIYIYELLSCIGEDSPQACYDRLIRLWGAYRGEYPNLDNYLYDWTYDFCSIHHLDYTITIDKNLRYFRKRFMIDKLISEQEGKEKFKLSFYTIDAICNYAITKSKFYEEHKSLLQEAIPRAVELVNAIYINREGKNFLEMYPEYKEKKHEYFGFISAICADQYMRLECAYKPYSTNIAFVQNIYEIARVTQNTFMCLYKVGNNRPKMSLDINISTLIESFVVNVYGYVKDFEDDEDFIPYEEDIEFDENFLIGLERKVPAVKAIISDLSEEKQDLTPPDDIL